MNENKEIKTRQLRTFGLLVGGIFAVIGLWPSLFRGDDPRLWVLAIAGMLMILALALPESLRLIYLCWIAAGQGLGWINTKIILVILFYGLFVPMGLVMRLSGKDPMRRRFEPDADTYRLVRWTRPSSHMARQF